ncbi:very-long-chain 3-oxooacyl-coa reductase [Anaeramoeba flamelloides]|uniref:Very-long-chain 3-oxooacyl-coa reductase n=1 Tax=Anaeramoeba flamelloides TaxID=1746091 RepID=A0AAV7ZJJ3_9EUKA|nr:very-long-chain 3-oxooacyl-coa reductase [Anaeramoeba flamelloides]
MLIPENFSPLLNLIFYIIGGIVALWFLIQFCLYIYKQYIRSPTILRNKFPKEEEVWAVITSIDDEIGKEYTLQLAKQGFSVAVFSDSVSRLTKICDLVADQDPKTKIKIIKVDWTEDLDDTFETVKNELEPLNVQVLVNNATVFPEKAELFHETPIEEDLKMVQVNIDVAVRMAKMLVPFMITKGGGYIINTSSWIMWNGLHYLSVYAGTKKFIANFSLSLHFEYVKEKIKTSYVLPFCSDFKFPYFLKLGFLNPSPRMYVKKTLGLVGTGYRISPFFSHWILEKIINQNFGIFNWLHNKWYKRSINKVKKND